MRLICPNCDAQYEVDDTAIPAAGRDVQCSNCGHAWFQAQPVTAAVPAAEEGLFGAPPALAAPIAPAPPQAPVANPPDDEVFDDDEDTDLAIPTQDTAESLARRRLDESLLAVLREEAEREAAQRRVEAPTMVETQADLGLEEPSTGSRASAAARLRVSQLRAAAPEAEVDLSRPAAMRRDLLPDIDEINSTLRASTERRAGTSDMTETVPEPVVQRGGFRSGFVLMMVVAVLLVSAYVMAPRIAEQMPGTAPALTAYVAGVDGLRLWLDGAMQRAIAALNG